MAPINALLYDRFIFKTQAAWLIGYVNGIIFGFVIGTFYGAIVGARREIARQKLEQKNASLSVQESEALKTL